MPSTCPTPGCTNKQRFNGQVCVVCLLNSLPDCDDNLCHTPDCNNPKTIFQQKCVDCLEKYIDAGHVLPCPCGSTVRNHVHNELMNTDTVSCASCLRIYGVTPSFYR